MTTSIKASPETGRITGAHVLAGMVLFFVLILAANTALIYTAVTTFGGLDNPHAYRDGLAYNARISAATAQAARGWRGQVETLSNPPRLRISLLDQARDPVRGLTLTATVGRPATTRYDARLEMRETEPGRFEGSLEALEPGSWILSYAAAPAGGAEADALFRAKDRLWLKP